MNSNYICLSCGMIQKLYVNFVHCIRSRIWCGRSGSECSYGMLAGSGSEGNYGPIVEYRQTGNVSCINEVNMQASHIRMYFLQKFLLPIFFSFMNWMLRCRERRQSYFWHLLIDQELGLFVVNNTSDNFINLNKSNQARHNDMCWKCC